MNVSKRKILKVLLGIVIFAGIPLSASSYQGDERSYSPEGAWLVKGEVAGLSYVWLDTYTSDSTRCGISGTILCTLPIESGATQSGHGNWIRIGKNTFAFTVLRIQIGPGGVPAGTIKFWGTVTVDTENEMSGTLNAQYFDLSGDPTSPALGPGTSTGKRIEVELEEQP